MLNVTIQNDGKIKIQSYDCNEIESVKSYLEDKGCVCEISEI